MEKIDLEIDNYDLSEILALFKIPTNFDSNHLKVCKKQVLKMHPDKSGLPKEYFLFFNKAYKILYTIYKFKHTEYDNINNLDYKDILNEDDKKAMKQVIDNFTNDKHFLEKFNKLFDQINIKTDFEQKGYEEWFKTSNAIELDTNTNNRNEAIENYKENQIIKKETIQDIETNSYTNIELSALENYGSNIFSSFQYEDLRKAHEESLIPVTQSDKREDYRNISELQKERSNSISIPSIETSRELLYNKKNMDEEMSTIRAYKLAKQGLTNNSMKDKIFNQLNYNTSI